MSRGPIPPPDLPGQIDYRRYPNTGGADGPHPPAPNSATEGPSYGRAMGEGETVPGTRYQEVPPLLPQRERGLGGEGVGYDHPLDGPTVAPPPDSSIRNYDLPGTLRDYDTTHDIRPLPSGYTPDLAWALDWERR